ncbi:MAG: SGNH/GDSL hydrolase family protein [Acidobacteriota bacterium]
MMTPSPPPLRLKVLTGLGVVYLLVGLLLAASDPLIHQLIAPEHRIWGALGRRLLLGAGLLLAGWGLVTLRFRRREAMANLNLMAASIVIITPVLAEAGLRAGIALGMPKVRQPGLYADYLSDGDYFRLHQKWLPEQSDNVVGRFHPMLGWAPPETADNPLGITAAVPNRYDPGAQAVLFYGDSFVAGSAVPMESRIPQILDRLLPDLQVFNYGVGGFGLGQIYLRFKLSHARFKKPTVIIGVMATDLDRSVLTFRTGPKPYFVLEDGRLVLHGAPMEEDSPRWRARYQPRLKSYLLAYLLRSWRILAGGGDMYELDYRRREKIDLNRRLLEAIIQEARDHDLPLLFVTFAARLDAPAAGWRERLLDRVLEQGHVPVLNTRDLFTQAARREGIPVTDFMRDDGHPTARANRLVAEALAEMLGDRPARVVPRS